MALTDDVAEAIATIRLTFAPAQVTIDEDGQGGAWVLVDPVPLGAVYAQTDTWLGFHIDHLSPSTDVYPHYVRPDLVRVDGQPLGEGFAFTQWGPHAEPATQISRRNNHHNPAIDTPVVKTLKVLEWVNVR